MRLSGALFGGYMKTVIKKISYALYALVCAGTLATTTFAATPRYQQRYGAAPAYANAQQYNRQYAPRQNYRRQNMGQSGQAYNTTYTQQPSNHQNNSDSYPHQQYGGRNRYTPNQYDPYANHNRYFNQHNNSYAHPQYRHTQQSDGFLKRIQTKAFNTKNYLMSWWHSPTNDKGKLFLAGLVVFRVLKAVSDSYHDACQKGDCSICYTSYGLANPAVRVCANNHFLHAECLVALKNNGHGRCPMCRALLTA